MKRISIALALGLVLLFAALAPALAEEANGQELYNKKCAMCHGKDGVAKAMAKGSVNFNDAAWKEKTSVEAIVKTTTDGIPDTMMKSYKDKLSAAEIKAIADYIKTL